MLHLVWVSIRTVAFRRQRFRATVRVVGFGWGLVGGSGVRRGLGGGLGGVGVWLVCVVVCLRCC